MYSLTVQDCSGRCGSETKSIHSNHRSEVVPLIMSPPPLLLNICIGEKKTPRFFPIMSLKIRRCIRCIKWSSVTATSKAALYAS